MIELVISGGQTGADQAGWRAAEACGIATGGWMPKGYLTEDGFRPEFADLYGAKEHSSSYYPVRRKANLDMTAMNGGSEHGLAVVFDATPKNKGMSPGTKGLYNDRAELFGRNDRCPSLITTRLVVVQGGFRITFDSHDVEGLTWAIVNCKARCLMVAGNRESMSPGIGEWVERYLVQVFRYANQ